MQVVKLDVYVSKFPGVKILTKKKKHEKNPSPYVPGSKLLVLGMVIPPLIGNPSNGYINPYYWVDDHPLLYGNNGSLDPGTYSHALGINRHILR